MNLIKPVSRQSSMSSASTVAPTLAKRFEEPTAPSEEEKSRKRGERLFSLDFLRGLDIFVLTVVGVVLFAADGLYKLPPEVMKQFLHPEWVGFSLYDMIMPLFIFMCGAALPLALPRYLESDGSASLTYWTRVLKRVAMLWILGMIVQGELFSFDLHRISFFNNTLQTIAVGYLFTAVVARIPSRAVQIVIPFALAGGYTAFLHFCGDMTPTGNAAVVYEVKFLELFYPHASWHPVSQILDMHYTWWTTIPMFGAMGLAGYHATTILLHETWDQKRKASVMMITGLALVGLGFALTTFDPCVKHIFTASFTSIAMGVSFVLYSICYTIFDIRRLRFGAGPIMLFGRNSLVAYLLVESCFKLALMSVPAVVLPGVKLVADGGGGYVFEGADRFGLLPVVLQCVALVFALYVWDWYKRGKSAAAKAAKEAAKETK